LKPRISEAAWTRLLAVLIVLAVMAAFTPALDNGFVRWDDPTYIVENPWIRALRWENIQWMLTTARGTTWLPLTWFSFALDYRFWGPDPYGFHLTNIALHLASALLVYAVGLRLLKSTAAACLAALFFAVHPMRVESVAWASERKDVLSGVFWLGALLAYLKAAEVKGRAGLYWSAAGVAAFGCAVCSKIVSLTLPAALLVLEIYPLRRLSPNPARWAEPSARPIWKTLAPYVLAAAAVAWVQLATAEVVTDARRAGALYRFTHVLYSLLYYPIRTLWPRQLSPYYAPPAWFGTWQWEFWLTGALVAAAAAALWALRRRLPGLVAAAAFFAVVLAPMSGIVQNGIAYRAFDRYSYLSCLGFACLFGMAMEKRRALAAVWLAILGCMTWRQCGVWKDTLTLWQTAQERAPGGCALSFWGINLFEAGRREEGLAAMEKSVELYPDIPLNYANLGVGLYRSGNERRAREVWKKGFELFPAPDLHADLGHALARGSEAEARESVAHLRAAVEASPTMEIWHLDLADALARVEPGPRAEAEYAAAAAINPGLGQAQVNWGLMLAGLGRRDEAVRHYRAALRVAEVRADAHSDWGNLLLSGGDWAGAERHYREALRIDPGLARVRVNLGNALVRRGRLPEAAGQYRAALKKDPGLKEAGVNLEAIRRFLNR
jgi:tetratricopeptide (TPR) repeat protein